MALSGSIKLTSGKAWEGRLYWSAIQDIAANCSYVSISVYTWKTDGYATSGGGWFTGSAWVGSESTSINYEQEDKNWGEGEDGHNPIWRASLEDVFVQHDDEGKGSVTIGASITKGYNTSLANTTLDGSATVTLDTIPRASSFAATDAAIGSVSTITIVRASKNIYHRIKAKFGSVEGYITNTGGFSETVATITGASVAFTVPDAFYAAIPNAKKGTCTLTMQALSGNAPIGDPVTTTFEVSTDPARCKPTLTIAVTHDNTATSSLTGSDAAFIRGYSNAKCTVVATGRFSATIKRVWTDGSYESNGGNVYTITPINSETIKFYAEDSRGYKGEVSTTVSLVPYIVLTNSAVAGRPNPTDGSAFIQFQGQYFNASFGKVANTLSIQYKIEYPDGSIDSSWKTVTPTKSTDSYSAYVSLSGFDYTKTYKVHTKVADKLLTLETVVLLKQGIPVFDWGRSDFQFNVPVKMGNQRIQNVGAPVSANDAVRFCDIVNPYPVGSIYMSVNSTSPASLFGGSWTQLQNRFLLGAGSSYTAGSTGGASAVTLTVDQIPSHAHWGVYRPSWYLHGQTGQASGVSDGTSNNQLYTDTTGGGKSHTNMPPYLVVYMWKRVS